MPCVVQTRPRCPLNGPPVYVVVDDWVADTYHLTTVAADATDFGSHVPANDWLALHPELLPGVLFVKWVLV